MDRPSSLHHPSAPIERWTRLSWRLLPSKSGRNQYHEAGVLVNARRCSDGATVASGRQWAHEYMKT